MKKYTILLLLIGIVAVSCQKDKNEGPTYEKSMLLGKWQQVTPDTGGEQIIVTFSDTEFEEVSGTGESALSLTYDYTFDGKVITYVFLVNVHLTINELTSTKLVVTQTADGYPNSMQFTYTKVP